MAAEWERSVLQFLLIMLIRAAVVYSPLGLQNLNLNWTTKWILVVEDFSGQWRPIMKMAFLFSTHVQSRWTGTTSKRSTRTTVLGAGTDLNRLLSVLVLFPMPPCNTLNKIADTKLTNEETIALDAPWCTLSRAPTLNRAWNITKALCFSSMKN